MESFESRFKNGIEEWIAAVTFRFTAGHNAMPVPNFKAESTPGSSSTRLKDWKVFKFPSSGQARIAN